MVCTFFGHGNASEKILVPLRNQIIKLIEADAVDTFYVGNHGKFDAMVKSVLCGLKADYPHINYYTVLAYLPGKRNEFDTKDYSDTIYPEGLED